MNNYGRNYYPEEDRERRYPSSSRRNPGAKTKKKIAKRNVRIMMFFFSASFFFIEMLMNLYTFRQMSFWQFILILLFSLSAGSLVSLCLSFIKNKKALKIVSAIILAGVAVLFSSQMVYFYFFKTLFGMDTLGMAGQLGAFMDNTIKAIFENILQIITLFIPFILLLIFFRRFSVYKRVPKSDKFRLVALAVLPFLLALFITVCDHSKGGFYYTYVHPSDNISQTAMDFGILTQTRLGIKSLIFGEPKPEEGDIDDPGHIDDPFDTKDPKETKDPAETVDPAESEETPTEPETPVVVGDNVLDIDFNSLMASAPNDTIKDMHRYFSTVTPTAKNKYTGYFKGKNLVFMTLEGFSGKVIDPELTPTLYMMANSSFVLDNFYCGCWGGSTATGEYANMTGLFFNTAKCLEMSAGVELPFSLGHQFKNIGYSSYAFHSNTNTYYSRNLSHPNMGYTFIAQGTRDIVGTDIADLTAYDGTKLTVKSWPHSDLELAKITVPLLVDHQPFHAYYMSISGHALYSWQGNKMSAKNKDKVANLDYSDEVKAYIACQLEVEYMLKDMIEEFREKGILDNTVFVMSADHYPYGLSDESLAELYDLPVDNVHAQFDLYRNTCFIWCAGMKETVHITDPCSAIDIIPTVSNLFGLEYDSRMLPGVDLNSDTVPLVILNCDGAGPYWCWINKYGEYNSKTGFTPYPGYENTDATQMATYVKSITNLAAIKKKYSFQILTENYFKYIK